MEINPTEHQPPGSTSANSFVDLNERDEIDRLLADLHARRYTDPPETRRAAMALYERSRAVGYERGAASALRLSGSANAFQSNLDTAEDELGRAEAMFRRLGDPVGLGLTLTAKGSLASRRGEYMRAIAQHEAALALLRESGNRVGECDGLVALGWSYHEVSLYAEALAVLTQARHIAEQEGELRCLLRALNNLACVVSCLDDRHSAEQLYHRALALARELKQPADEAAILGNLSVQARIRGELAVAASYIPPGLKACRRLGLRKAEAVFLMQDGELNRISGDLERAETRFTDALALAITSGEVGNVALALEKLGTVRLDRGDANGALRCLTDGLSVALTAGLTSCERDIHLALAGAHEKLGDSIAALRHHRAYHDAAMQVQAAEGKVGAQQRKVIEHLERLKQEMEVTILRSELRVLKAQLQPHFLFNAMNSIAALMHRDVAAADAMLLKLGDLLRMALRQSSRHEVTLADELEFLSLYLQIEGMRLGSALDVRLDVEDRLMPARVPHLILQPLVENALKHGLQGHPRGRLTIRARSARGGMMELVVRDNGTGLPDGWSMDDAGVGLNHTRERLRLMYGANYAFEITPARPGGTVVRLRFPLSATTAQERPAAVPQPRQHPSAHLAGVEAPNALPSGLR
jgi:tetratricopeptide (TPR) repeat protein